MKRLGLILTWPVCVLVRFWARPVRAEPLALFRILLGACLLLNLWITIIPVADILVGSDGLCATESIDPYIKRAGLICLLRGPISIPLQEKFLPLPPDWTRAWAEWGATPQAAYTLFGVYTFSVTCMTVGLFTRLATIVSWALNLTLFQRLTWTMNGGDDVARMALFYLMFARSGVVWSLDSWWFRGRKRSGLTAPPRIPAWPLRLMQIQLCLVYLFTGLVKLGNQVFTSEWSTCDWINGEALYWLYNDLEITRWPYHWTPFPLWLCRLQTWGVMVFELGFSVFVLFRWTRPWVLVFGVLMHLGIWLHTEIAFFSQYMLCWYVLFVPGQRLADWMAWPRRFWRGSKKDAAPPHQQDEPTGLVSARAAKTSTEID